MRQGRIYLLGHTFRHLEFKVEVDFAPEEPSLTDAYVGWRSLGPLGTVRAGHQKQPFSFEQQMSRLNMVFMERSLANSLTPDVRNIGLTFRNTLLDGRLYWAVGGFRDTTSNGYTFVEPPAWFVAAHLTGLPVWREDGAELLHLGVSYQHAFRDPDGTISLRSRPESRLADRLIDTGPISGVHDQDRLGLEVVYRRGPFALQAEGVATFLHRDAAPGDLDFWGGYAQVSWFATGERRPYIQGRGHFGGVSPRRDFDPVRGGWGALQLAARLSYAGLDDKDVRGGEQIDTTVGINWWLFPFVRLTFNWVHGWVLGEGDVDVLQARFQLAY